VKLQEIIDLFAENNGFYEEKLREYEKIVRKNMVKSNKTGIY